MCTGSLASAGCDRGYDHRSACGCASCGIRKSRRHRKLSTVRQLIGKRRSAAVPPDGCQSLDPAERRSPALERAVEGANAGADHHVRGNSVRGERLQHAHLDGAEAASARENERRFHRANLFEYRQRLLAPLARRIGDRPRDVRAVIAAGSSLGHHFSRHSVARSASPEDE